MHRIDTSTGYTWDGNVTLPCISPMVTITEERPLTEDELAVAFIGNDPAVTKIRHCVAMIVDGRAIYGEACTHALAGMAADLLAWRDEVIPGLEVAE